MEEWMHSLKGSAFVTDFGGARMLLIKINKESWLSVPAFSVFR